MLLYLTAFCPVLSEYVEQLISVILLTDLHLFQLFVMSSSSHLFITLNGSFKSYSQELSFEQVCIFFQQNCGCESANELYNKKAT